MHLLGDPQLGADDLFQLGPNRFEYDCRGRFVFAIGQEVDSHTSSMARTAWVASAAHSHASSAASTSTDVGYDELHLIAVRLEDSLDFPDDLIGRLKAGALRGHDVDFGAEGFRVGQEDHPEVGHVDGHDDDEGGAGEGDRRQAPTERKLQH